MRLTKQLSMKVRQVDFSMNLVTAIHTKTRRNRQIPMSPEVRVALLPLCAGNKKREAVKAAMFQQARVIEMPVAMRKEA